MEICIYPPSDILRPFIESYTQVDINWAHEHSLASSWRLIPFGKPTVILLQADPHLYSIANAGMQPELTPPAFLAGQMKVPVWLQFSGHTKMIKVQFRPAGLRQFIKQDMSAFSNNGCTPLEEIWGRAVSELLDQLRELQQFTLPILNGFFEKRMLPRLQQTDPIYYAIRQFESSMGSISLAELEQRLHISGRHLERIFKMNVGLTPKDYRKLIRLNRAFSYLEKNPGTSFTDVSHSTGYYDQAHFTHDFKQFAGSKPSTLRSLNTGELFVTNGKCFLPNPFTVN